MSIRITGYVPARMVNLEKCAVYEEDSDDITFLTDKSISEGLTLEETLELQFLRDLMGV